MDRWMHGAERDGYPCQFWLLGCDPSLGAFVTSSPAAPSWVKSGLETVKTRAVFWAWGRDGFQ